MSILNVCAMAPTPQFHVTANYMEPHRPTHRPLIGGTPRRGRRERSVSLALGGRQTAQHRFPENAAFAGSVSRTAWSMLPNVKGTALRFCGASALCVRPALYVGELCTSRLALSGLSQAEEKARG